MKSALAIVFSLLLVGTGLVPARSLPATDNLGVSASCCCDCTRMACCAARPSSTSQPVSPAPVSSASQDPFLRPAFALLAWSLPATADGEFPSASLFSLSIIPDAPLYARDCARLI